MDNNHKNTDKAINANHRFKIIQAIILLQAITLSNLLDAVLVARLITYKIKTTFCAYQA